MPGPAGSAIDIKEFSDLGSGLALTFRFMKTGGGYFLTMFFVGLIGWIVQLVDPSSVRACCLAGLVCRLLPTPRPRAHVAALQRAAR